VKNSISEIEDSLFKASLLTALYIIFAGGSWTITLFFYTSMLHADSPSGFEQRGARKAELIMATNVTDVVEGDLDP